MDQTLNPEINWADGFSLMPCFLTAENKQFPAIGFDFLASATGGTMSIVFVGEPETLLELAKGVQETAERAIEAMNVTEPDASSD
jgi:hypothetical protein